MADFKRIHNQEDEKGDTDTDSRPSFYPPDIYRKLWFQGRIDWVVYTIDECGKKNIQEQIIDI